MKGKDAPKVEEAPKEKPADDPKDKDEAKDKDEKPAPKKAEVGLTQRATGDGEHKFWIYVPAKYDPNVSYGALVWLHPPGRNKEADIKEFVEAWEEICDKTNLILISPKSENADGWIASEAEFVVGAVRDASKVYWALTIGAPLKNSGTIKASLAKEGGLSPTIQEKVGESFKYHPGVKTSLKMTAPAVASTTSSSGSSTMPTSCGSWSATGRMRTSRVGRQTSSSPSRRATASW